MIKNKFLHPPVRTSFLSMLLLFPYFLCCPPSPPCRAALHAGACWPWRPTRYCQPTFHVPFCGLKIFLWKDVYHAWELTSLLYLHLCLRSTAFFLILLMIPKTIEIVNIPKSHANIWDWINLSIVVHNFLFAVSFSHKKGDPYISAISIFRKYTDLNFIINVNFNMKIKIDIKRYGSIS